MLSALSSNVRGAETWMNIGVPVRGLRVVSFLGASVSLEVLSPQEVSSDVDTVAAASRQAMVRNIVICDMFFVA